MNKSLITEPLGLFGWSHLELVILAALASESPMLLIGKHGSAKSFILERLAESLNLEFRCYNASLINYDDLVGIPVPINNNTSLSYISSPNSIWDAEVVFIDELNRTKAELQNKLFPIIYDKRVQRINLTKLKYRWAAMNPPCVDEDADENDISYLGAMPLDPALADRFPYIIEVPTWDELNDKDKTNMLFDTHLGRHEFPIDVHSLIKSVKEKYCSVLKEKEESFSNYIINLMTLLKNSFGYISARRATMLEESLLYLYAAFCVLDTNTNTKTRFEDVAYLHIQNTLPNLANEKIDKVLLLSIAKQALELSRLNASVDKDVLLISDPIERLKFLIKHSKDCDIEVINNTITSSLSQISDKRKRRAMSLFSYLTFRSNRKIYAAVMETIANDVRPIIETKTYDQMHHIRDKRIADVIVGLCSRKDAPLESKKYLNNFLYSFFPGGYADEDDLRSVYTFFVETWKELRL